MNDEVTDSLQEQFWALKRKWREECMKLYPSAQQPEMAWLFDAALGIDARSVALEPITKKTYKVFLLDENNKRVTRYVHDKTDDGLTGWYDEAVVVVRKFTPAQQKIVREWWVLIPSDMKAQD